MTDAHDHIPADRRPEFPAATETALAAERAARVPRLPRNPWLTTLFWLWLGSLLLVVVLEIIGAGANGPSSDGELPSSYDPGLQSAVQGLALVFIGIAFFTFIAWMTVKALSWRPAPAVEDVEA